MSKKGIDYSLTRKVITYLDIFGAKIELQYKCDTRYRTFTGGICGFIFLFLYFLFFVYEMNRMFSLESYVIEETH